MSIIYRIKGDIQRHPVRWIAASLFVFHAINSLFVFSTNDLNQTDEQMVLVGKSAANALFYGNEQAYNKLAPENMQTAREGKCVLDEVLVPEIGDAAKRRKIHSIYNGKSDNGESNRIQLLKIEKRGQSFAVATFGISDEDGHQLWGNDIPALVTLTLKYSLNYPESPAGRYLHQLANASYLPNFIRRAASGRWEPLDGYKTMCAPDYFRAVLQGKDEDPIYRGHFEGKSIEQLAQEISNTWKDRTERSIEEILNWSVKRSGVQFIETVNDLRESSNLPPIFEWPEENGAKPPKR